mmetsp:Transcript_20194/g.48138  ORF Transcript_20194/g.48138 Transcript_20194/m.48138 type:complete len:82 (-) Transcript_20194:1479-1724(-)
MGFSAPTAQNTATATALTTRQLRGGGGGGGGMALPPQHAEDAQPPDAHWEGEVEQQSVPQAEEEVGTLEVGGSCDSTLGGG